MIKLANLVKKHSKPSPGTNDDDDENNNNNNNNNKKKKEKNNDNINNNIKFYLKAPLKPFNGNHGDETTSLTPFATFDTAEAPSLDKCVLTQRTY